MSFVENSFKHLSHYTNGKQNKIGIHLSNQNGSMQLTVHNTMEDKTAETKDHAGIGLNNVKKRLALLYPGEHELKITQENGCFNVDLKIAVNQKS